MARLGDVPDRPEDKVKGEERAAIFMFHSVLRWPEEVLTEHDKPQQNHPRRLFLL